MCDLFNEFEREESSNKYEELEMEYEVEYLEDDSDTDIYEQNVSVAETIKSCASNVTIEDNFNSLNACKVLLPLTDNAEEADIPLHDDSNIEESPHTYFTRNRRKNFLDSNRLAKLSKLSKAVMGVKVEKHIERSSETDIKLLSPPKRKRHPIKKQNFDTDSSLDSDSCNESGNKRAIRRKNRRCDKDWHLDKTYPHFDAAEAAVKAEDTWSFRNKSESKMGLKFFYRCNQVKYTGPQCAASLYIGIPSDSKKALVYRTIHEHSHDEVANPGHRSWVTDELQNKIRSYLKLHMKPRQIFNRLLQIEGIILPSIQQLYNYISYVKTQQQSPRKNIDKSGCLYSCPQKFNSNLIPSGTNCANSHTPHRKKSVYVRKRNLHDWVFGKKFNNAAEANAAIKAENTWRLLYKQQMTNGIKFSYRCNKTKYRGPQCAALIYLLHEAISESVLLFHNNCDHTHDSIVGGPPRGIEEEVKAEIKKMFKLNLKSREAFDRLRDMRGIRMPSMTQLLSYYNQLKREELERSGLALIVPYQTRGLSEKVKDEVNRLIKLNFKPKQVMNRLRNMKEIKMPSREQVVSYMKLCYRRSREQSEVSTNRSGEIRGIDRAVKLKIAKMFNAKVDTVTIFRNLQKTKGIRVPTKVQLFNYVSQLKRKHRVTLDNIGSESESEQSKSTISDTEISQCGGTQSTEYTALIADDHSTLSKKKQNIAQISQCKNTQNIEYAAPTKKGHDNILIHTLDTYKDESEMGYEVEYLEDDSDMDAYEGNISITETNISDISLINYMSTENNVNNLDTSNNENKSYIQAEAAPQLKVEMKKESTAQRRKRDNRKYVLSESFRNAEDVKQIALLDDDIIGKGSYVASTGKRRRNTSTSDRPAGSLKLSDNIKLDEHLETSSELKSNMKRLSLLKKKRCFVKKRNYDKETSSDRDSSKEHENTPRKKNRRCENEWVFNKAYSNFDVAEAVVKAENTWSFRNKSESKVGLKFFYRCNKVKLTGPQCAASLYICIPSDSKKVLVYRTIHEHSHDKIANPGHRSWLTDELRKKIQSYLNLHMKPRQIFNRLLQMEGIIVPSMKQIYNYINFVRSRQRNPHKTKNSKDSKRWHGRSWNVTQLNPSKSRCTNSHISHKKRNVRDRKIIRHDWVFDKKFKNAAEANTVLQRENTWRLMCKQQMTNGVKFSYRCNKTKYRGPQCAALIYLLYEAKSESVLLFHNNCDHTHDSIVGGLPRGIDKEVKSEIEKMFKLNLKPREVFDRLRDIRGIRMPSMIQLLNYFNQLKRGELERSGLARDMARPTRGLSEEVKEEIKSLIEFNYKPREIMKRLRELNEMPSREQVVSYMKRCYRRLREQKISTNRSGEIRGIDGAVKLEIAKMLNAKMDPAIVFSNLQNVKGIRVPTRVQVYHYIYHLKKKRRFPLHSSRSESENFLNKSINSNNSVISGYVSENTENVASIAEDSNVTLSTEVHKSLDSSPYIVIQSIEHAASVEGYYYNSLTIEEKNYIEITQTYETPPEMGCEVEYLDDSEMNNYEENTLVAEHYISDISLANGIPIEDNEYLNTPCEVEYLEDIR